LANNGFCNPGAASYPKWSGFDAIWWKFGPEALGGGRPTLMRYKAGWIVFNKTEILAAARDNRIPADLLGCVAFNEVGGDPPFIKRSVVLPLRQFDWSCSDWGTDLCKPITKPPAATSEGAIKIQLRIAASVIGYNPKSLDSKQQNALTECLETDQFNIAVVAKLLHDIILFDYPKADTTNLSDEQFILAGSRYNRGNARPLADFQKSLKDKPGAPSREFTSYGRSMMNHRGEVRDLLGMSRL